LLDGKDDLAPGLTAVAVGDGERMIVGRRHE
jgi:hypothetical protein